MTTTIRATALPLPEVSFSGEVVTLGYGQGMARYRTATIGTEAVVVRADHAFTVCWKCSGSGFISAYAGIYDGVCFSCNGTGRRLLADTLEGAQRKVRSAQAAALRAEAKAEAERPAREAAAAAALREIIEKAHGEAIREQAARDAKAAEQAAQRFAGEVGSKVTVTGVVKVSMSVDGFRPGSYSCLVIVEGTGADAGITLKTVGTSEWHWNTEKGAEVTVTATVKDHSEYRGTKQTVVVRPKG